MPRDARSRSPPPIEFSIVDLTVNWPLYTLTASIQPQDLVTTEIFPNDKHGGSLVYEFSKGSEVQYRIPSHYHHAVCILSAKISWLKMNCTLLMKMAKLEKENIPLLNTLDGLRRSLTFSIRVRHLFYEDVKTAYPVMDTKPKPVLFSPDFRSKHLDSWLYVEFHAVTHHPPRYMEYSQMKHAEKHPLDITVQGGAISSQIIETCLINNAEWLEWADKNRAEWLSERGTPLQEKGKLRHHLVHRSDEITNDKFIEYIQEEVQKLGKVAGGMSGDLVAKLLGDQVKTEEGRGKGEDEDLLPKKRKASSSTSTSAKRKMPDPRGKDKGKGKVDQNGGKSVSQGAERAMEPSVSDELILVFAPGSRGAISITNADLERLQPGIYLNDTLIDFGLKLWIHDLRERDPSLADSIHVFNPFFYKKLSTKNLKDGYTSIQRWTAKTDIFSKQYIIVPINENLHWYLAIIYQPEHILQRPVSTKGKRESGASQQTPRTYIFTLDSLGSNHPKAINILTDYLNFEAKYRQRIVEPTPAIGKQALVPMQPNNSDCGIYLLHLAETFISDPVHYFHTITLQKKSTSTHSERKAEWKDEKTGCLREKLSGRIIELSRKWKIERSAKEEPRKGSERRCHTK